MILPSLKEEVLMQSLARLQVYIANFNAVNPEISISCSVGAAVACRGEELDAAINKADMLMYQDKAAKKGAAKAAAK